MSNLPDNDQRWKDRGDRAYSEFTEKPKRTAAKWFAWILAGVIVLAIIGGVIGFIGGWFDKYSETVGPENTEEQFTALYGLYESMEATAGNVCSAEGAEASDQAQQFLEDPEFSYEATYRNQQAEYDRRMRNEFEAEWLLLKPDGLPLTAPSLEQMKAQVC